MRRNNLGKAGHMRHTMVRAGEFSNSYPLTVIPDRLLKRELKRHRADREFLRSAKYSNIQS